MLSSPLVSTLTRTDVGILLLAGAPLLAALAGAPGPQRIRLNLGPGDGPYVTGFPTDYEIDEWRSAQWSKHRATIDLPLSIQGGPVTLTYRYSRPVPEDGEAQVLLAGDVVDRFSPKKSPDERRVRLAALASTPLVLGFDVDSSDPRGLGLRLDDVVVATGDESRVRLRGVALVRPALLALLVFLVLRVAGWRPGAAALWTAPWSVGATALLLRDPWLVHRLLTGLPEWLFPLGLGGALLASALRRRGVIDAESARMTVALTVTAFLGRAALFNAPDYYYPDLRIHAKLAELVRNAGWDFLRAPARYIVRHQAWARVVDGKVVAFPYTPAFHAFFALTRLPYDGLVTALKLGTAAATVVPIVALWALARRWGASTLGCVLLLVVPTYVHHLGLAYLAALFGHAVDMLVLAWLAGHLRDVTRPRTFAAAALLVAASQLAYVAAVIVLPIFLTVLALFVAFVDEDASRRRRAAAILAFGAAGSLLAILLFYRHFSPLVTQALSHAAHGVPVAASDDAPRQPFLQVFWVFTRKYFDYLWTPAALAGLVLLVRRGAGRPVILAWGSTYLVLLLGRAHLPFVFQHPHDALFVTPLVCLAAGEAVAALARRGTAGRWAAAVVLCVLSVQGLLVQWHEWSRHLHPEL
jgi:hypothetical protein